MSPLVWVLFFATVALDVWGQTAFKLGLERVPEGASGLAFWKGVVLNSWILGGFFGYCFEACFWLYVVGHAPLSVVGPMAALAYVGAVVSGRLFLGEHAGKRRWLGAGLITLGAACLAASLG